VKTITANLQLTKNSKASKHQNLSAQKDCTYMQNCHFFYAVISFTSVFQEHGFSSRSLDIREPSSYIDTLLVLVERGYQTVPVRHRSNRTNYMCNTTVYQCHVQQSQNDYGQCTISRRSDPISLHYWNKKNCRLFFLCSKWRFLETLNSSKCYEQAKYITMHGSILPHDL
jgi:hypothetical protein